MGEQRLGHLGARLDGREDLEALAERVVCVLPASERRQNLSENSLCRTLLEPVAAALGSSQGLARGLDSPRRIALGEVELGQGDLDEGHWPANRFAPRAIIDGGANMGAWTQTTRGGTRRLVTRFAGSAGWAAAGARPS